MKFRQYAFQARRLVLFALLPAIVAGVLAYVYTKHQAKTYQATSVLLVQQSSSPLNGVISSGTDVQQSLPPAAPGPQMLTSTNRVLAPADDQAMQKKWVGYRIEQHQITAAQPQISGSSQLISVSVNDRNPERAADAVDALCKAFI